MIIERLVLALWAPSCICRSVHGTESHEIALMLSSHSEPLTFTLKEKGKVTSAIEHREDVAHSRYPSVTQDTSLDGRPLLHTKL